jgi:hypothetical protein
VILVGCDYFPLYISRFDLFFEGGPRVQGRVPGDGAGRELPVASLEILIDLLANFGFPEVTEEFLAG